MKSPGLLFLAFLSAFFSINIFGQSTPQWAWARSAGISNGLSDVCTDASGNVYITGSFNGPSIVFGTYTLVNSSPQFSNFFLVKYDSLGNVLWARSGGGIDGAGAFAITTTKRGVVIVGSFANSALVIGQTTLTTGPGNNSDMFVARYDYWGNLMWAKAADAQWCFPNAVTTDVDGNIYVTGQFGGPMVIDAYMLNTSADNVFLLKMDETGTALWGVSGGNNQNDKGTGVAVGPNGDVYFGGNFNDDLTFDGSTIFQATPGCDIFVARFTPNGAPLWVKQFGGNNGDCLASLASDKNGNVFLTGSFYSPSLDFGSTKLKRVSTGDIFVAKLDDQGTPAWALSFGAGCASEGSDICVDEVGDAYVTGTYNSQNISFGTFSFSHSGPAPFEMYVTKVSRNGQVAWARNASSFSGYDIGHSVAVDLSGNVYSTGYYYSPWVAFDSDTVTAAAGGNDIYFARLKGNVLDRPKVIDVGLTNTEPSSIQVYPNPTTGIFTLASDVTQSQKIEVFDVFGRVVLQQAVTDNETTVDLRGQRPGVYIVVSYSEKSSSAERLILH